MKTLQLFIILFLAMGSSAAMSQEKAKAEKAYIVHDKTNKISRVDVRKDLKSTGSVIQFDVSNASGGASMASRAEAFAPATITAVNIVNGSYNLTRELGKSSRGMTMQLLDVVYPCRVRVTVSEQLLDIEIKEPGFWKVSVGLIN